MSEMDMVERVARALQRIASSSHRWEFSFSDDEGLALARAAIEAIEQEAVIVKPYGKVTWHGEGADEEYELVPVARQQVYEQVIAELKERVRQ